MKVYLVEDSPILRDRVIESLAETRNCVVGSADTEDDAVSGIVATKPDAIVVDIQLRRGNGLNVLRRLKRLHLDQHPVVVVLTNYSNPEYRIRAFAAGSDCFLDKSSEFHRLGEVLDRLDSSAQSTRAGAVM